MFDLLHLNNVGDIKLDELAVKWLWSWRDVWNHKLREVCNHSAILAVATEGECCAAFNHDLSRVVDGKDAVANLVLTVKKVV